MGALGDGLVDDLETQYGTDIKCVGYRRNLPQCRLTDSDNDSIYDYYDPDPMEFTITDRIISWAEGLSYTNLTSYIGKTVGYAIDHGADIKGISDEYVKYLRDAVIVH